MPRSVGIHFSGQAIRLVELEGSSKKFKVRAISRKDVSDGKGDEQNDLVAAAFTAAFEESGASKDSVYTALDSSILLVRPLVMPFIAPEQIRKTLKFEFENHIHNIAAEDIVVDFYKVAEEAGQSRLLAAGCPKKALSSHLDMLYRAGIAPIAVDADVVALFNAFAFTASSKEHPSSVLVWVDKKFVKTAVVIDGVFVTMRAARFDATSSNFDQLTGLVESAVLSASALTAPTAVFVCSDHPLKDQIISALSVRLGIPGSELVLAPQPGIEAGLCPSPETPGTVSVTSDMAVAFGLALKGLDFDKGGMDFRQEELKFEKKFDALKKSVTFLLLLAFTLLMMVAAMLTSRNRDLSAASEELLKRQFDAAKPLEIEIGVSSDVLQTVKNYQVQFESAIGDSDYPLPVSALEYCSEFFSKLSSTKLSYMYIKTLRISNSQKSLLATGEMYSSDISVLTSALNNSPFFKTNVPSTTKIDDDRVSFSYTITLEKP